MKRSLKIIALISIILVVLVLGYFSIGSPQQAEKITWGVNFSQKHTEYLGLDWKKTYKALLEDLGAREIKVAAHWDIVEPKEGEYHFEDLDWQIQQAKEHEARILLIIGMKTSRWPECHIPEWAQHLGKEKQQELLIALLKEIVIRYQQESVIWAWQVENEPFFPFGECPWQDKAFLKQEVSLVKSLDGSGKPVVISESGEGSLWTKAARIGDIVGITLYRKVWFAQLGISVDYPFRPIFYWRKAQMIKNFFGKKVIGVELQAEPWGAVLLYDLPLSEQEKTMNLEQFRKNIAFAKNTGLDTFYLWGAEWWFQLKEKQGKPEIWEEAKTLFQKS